MSAAPHHVGDLRLEILEGPTLAPFALVGSDPMILGRGQRCALRTPEAELSVSREHCQFDPAPQGWLVRDLSSRHGTYLNDVRLAPESPAPLREGDRVRVGPWTLRVVSTETPNSTISMHDAPGAAERLVPVTDVARESIHRRRLELLLDFAKQAQTARDEAALAEAAVQMLADATGYSVVAFIKPDLAKDQLQVLAVQTGEHRRDTIIFSRSLIRAAATGQAVKLRRDAEMTSPLVTNSLVGVQTVLCVPIMLDGAMACCLYLDCREGHMRIQDDAAAFCQAVADLCSMSLSAIRRSELELVRTRNDEQMQTAMRIQQTILPPQNGRVLSLRYSMHVEPGRFVAGDLFDIFQIDDRRVAMLVGDVSGKGVPAAMLAALTQSYLTAALRNTGDLSMSMTALNRHLAEKMPDSSFVSLVGAIIDVEARRLDVVDAGHGYWLVREPTGALTQPDVIERGLPLRVAPDVPYTSATLDFARGSRIILLSDGVIEQRSRNTTDEFGMSRVLTTLASSADCKDDVRLLLHSVKAHAMGTADASAVDLSDDVTVASVELPSE